MNQKKSFIANFVLGYAVLVGLLVGAAAVFGPAAAYADEAALEAGYYSAQVETSTNDDALTATVDSPCLLEVASTGETVARIAWSKNDVVRMVVNDVEYLPTSSDLSEFVIPVSAIDAPLAMEVEVAGEPNQLVPVSLTFSSANIDNSDEALDALASDTEYEAMPLTLEGEGQESSNMEANANSQAASDNVQWVTFAGWAIIAIVAIGVGVSIFVRVRKNK